LGTWIVSPVMLRTVRDRKETASKTPSTLNMSIAMVSPIRDARGSPPLASQTAG
jgi:hypothetical protein